MGDTLPRFQVEQVSGKVRDQIASQNKDTGGFDYTTVQADAGYMVYFPQGHSIRVKTHAELVRLGFAEEPDDVDMETGDIINRPRASLKNLVARKTQAKDTIATINED